MQVHRTPTVLLTRPQAASEAFAEGLQGADVVIAPLMAIVPTGVAVDLERVDGLILTSQAVIPFVPSTALPAYCVGPRTTQAARDAGVQAECAGQDADALVDALADRKPKGALLHLHGTHTRGQIAQRLTALGLSVRGLAVYDQQDAAPTPAFHDALTRPDLIVPLFSPRSAEIFAAAARSLRPDTVILALSPAVAEALPRKMQAQTRISPAPTGQEMRKRLAVLGVGRNSP